MFDTLIAMLRGRRYGLRSSASRERPFEASVNGKTVNFVHSSFNTNWLTELGITPKTIVDLGSFDGGDAYRFKQTFPDARVITVEADPDRFAKVQDSLQGQDIETLNFAACETDQHIPWYSATIQGEVHAQGSIYQHTDAYKSQFPFVEQTQAPLTIEGKRFDSFCRDNNVADIGLLHMDIEGAEHTVLESLGAARPRLIFLEWREGFFQGKSCGPETEKLLDSLGYKLVLRKRADRLYFLPE